MPNALMNWDTRQSRWRAMYKGRRLQVKAADLVIGASTYDETVLAANQWFRQQQEWIDKEAAVEKSRPYEEDYYAELANIQSAINSLPVIARDNPALQSMLAPEVAKLKRRATLIKQTLRQEVLPPLDNTLRNPLNVSPARIKEDAALEAKQQIADRLRKGSVFSIDHKELEDHEEYIPYDAVELDDFMDGDYRNHAAYNRQMRMIDEHNRELADSTLEDRIQNEAGEFASLQDGLVARMKEETGAIDEYERGMITQLLNEHGADVPESKQLAHNIEKFLEHQHRRWATKKISAGRLGKIANTMKRYKDWTRITNVEKVGTREHIADYHRALEDLVIAEDIKPEYANNLFGTFRMLVLWLAKAGVFKEYPHWLLDNSKDYAFPVERQKPVTVPLEWVHRILDAASPRLQLCILLTLNCGFGASEIGQLEKDEYNPSEGRITHKRCKTQKSENAPTVCYKLWDNTRELLDQAVVKSKKYPSRSESENHLLINRNGYPLWYEYVANGKSSKYDNITCDFRRMIAKLRTADPNVPAITYYQFRRTSASLIYNEPRYRMYNGLWLAHSPRSVADRHYNDPDSSILDETILWLHGKIFGTDEE